MRTLPKRTRIAKSLRERLAEESAAISTSADPKTEAQDRWKKARASPWFEPVVKKLRRLAGRGQRCMYCSGSEASDVEHFRPLSPFPTHAMKWDNYLWSCTPCNRTKSDRFPPDTGPGARIIDPMAENVWDFFFIDRFGLLTPKWDLVTNGPNARAVSTRDTLGLNRDAVSDCRRDRLRDLRAWAKDTVTLFERGDLSQSQVRKRIATKRGEPFQPDVADYFLRGPGVNEMPFSALLRIIG